MREIFLISHTFPQLESWESLFWRVKSSKECSCHQDERNCGLKILYLHQKYVGLDPSVILHSNYYTDLSLRIAKSQIHRVTGVGRDPNRPLSPTAPAGKGGPKNHRIVWVAKAHNAHPVPTPAMCRVTNQQPRLPRATSSLALNACRDGASYNRSLKG